MRVLLYRVKKNNVQLQCDENSTNADYLDHDSYSVNSNILKLVEWIKSCNITAVDFGLNLVLIAFAEFYTKNQFHVFSGEYKIVNEIDLINNFVALSGKNALKIKTDLIVDSEYGLFKNMELFKSKKPVTMRDYQSMISLLTSNVCTPKLFIKKVSMFHIKIINAFYLFLSVNRESKLVVDCLEIKIPKFPYKFPVPLTMYEYTGDYWFGKMSKDFMFAYYNKKINVNKFIDCNILKSMSKFDSLNSIVFGYISEGFIFPIWIEDSEYKGNWTKTINKFMELGFNSPLRIGTPPITKKFVYFVKHNDLRLYKYIINLE